MAERPEEVTRDHLRQLSGGVRLPKDATHAMVRLAHGFGLMLDSSPVLTERHPDLWRRVDGGLELHVRCAGLMVRDGAGVMRHRKCENEAWLACPGGRVPPIAVRLVSRWMCEDCSARDDEHVARMEKGAELAKRLRESGIPGGLAGEATWETMLEKGGSDEDTKKRIRAIQVCKEWSEKAKPAHALLLHGPPGTGKTRLAATAAMARLQHSPIQWVSVAILMAQLDAAWNDEERHRALKVLTGTGPVVLDDLDKINPTQRVLGHLFAAIDKREQAGQHALIITTNEKPSDLERKLGDVLLSRVVGMCHSNAGLLAFPGPDRRLELGESEGEG